MREYDKKRAAHSGCSKLYERIAISEVITLLVEEILESADSKFVTGSFVANNDGSRMGLKHRSSPLVADVAVNDVLESTSLVVTIANEEHLLGSHHSADTYGESLLGHKVDIVVEEARIGDDGVGSQRLDMSKAIERRARLVESKMTIGAYATHEEMNATGSSNSLLVISTLGIEVVGISIEDMNVLGLDVDVAEEVLPHETML